MTDMKTLLVRMLLKQMDIFIEHPQHFNGFGKQTCCHEMSQENDEND